MYVFRLYNSDRKIAKSGTDSEPFGRKLSAIKLCLHFVESIVYVVLVVSLYELLQASDMI